MKLTPRQEVILSIASYSFCSGTLVLLNKLTLHYLPFPSLVVAFQLLACVGLVYGAQLGGLVNVDPIVWEYVKPYSLYIFFFSTGVYCNMRSLTISNVETVIVFRALSPLLVAFMDSLCLGREWPSKRSWAGLFVLVLGAYGYAREDERFQTQGWSAYTWPSLYTIVIALEMAYGKKIVKSVPLETKSGPVIYTNLLGFLPMLLLANVGHEYEKFWDFWWKDDDHHIPPASIPFLILGCLVGTGIGYSGWWCRDVVSATSFTLIGVMNKCLTIFLNILIWDKHATPRGIFFLFVCIGGGMVYQQSPMKPEFADKQGGEATNKSEQQDVDEEKVELIRQESGMGKRSNSKNRNDN